MAKTVRGAIAVSAACAALLAGGAGLAHADTDDAPVPTPTAATLTANSGTGSGLTGGPTQTQVLKGAPAVPLGDPTLGEGTGLPPLYNAVDSFSG